MILPEKFRQIFLQLFSLIILGCITLPMLPVWQGSIRLLALCFIFKAVKDKKQKLILSCAFLLLFVGAGYWVFALSQHPFSHIVGSLTDVFGQPLGLIPDLCILIVDLIAIYFLLRWLLSEKDNKSRLLPAAFWLSCLPALIATYIKNPTDLPVVLTSQSGWGTWVYFAILPQFLAAKTEDLQKIAKSMMMGATAVASVIILQWLLHDYSYVLDTPDFRDYFFRVRGTDYYHASATYTLAVLMPLILLLRERKHLLIGILLIITVAGYLNNTRGISLSIVAASSILALVFAYKRIWWYFSISAVLALIFATSILYIKPVSGLTTSVADNSELSEIMKGLQVVKPKEGLDSLISANESRSLLLTSGLKTLNKNIYFGSGSGNLVVPLPGNAFNGMRSTYSTHVFFLDMLLMSGFVAFIFLIMFFIQGLVKSGLITLKKTTFEASEAGLFGSLIIFLAGSFFLPQERNEIIGIAFCLCSLAIRSRVQESDNSPESVPDKHFNILRGLIIFAMGGWAIVTSPGYIFPAIEFSIRYGSEVKESNSKVKTTEPAIVPVLKSLLKLKGISNPDVSTLKDDTNDLSHNTWILWSPSNDFRFPKLRKFYGYQQYRQGGHSPSLRAGPEWWIKSSSQPTFSFVFAGMKPEIYVRLEDLGRITSSGDKKKFLLEKNFPGDLQIEVYEDTDPERPLKILFLKSDAREIEFEENQMLKLKVQTFSDSTPYFDLAGTENVVGYHRNIGDFNFGSFVFWPAEQKVTFVFDVGTNTEYPIVAYRISPLSMGGLKYSTQYSWKCFASNDGKVWVKLDDRRNEELSLDAKQTQAYYIGNKRIYRFYRFDFLEQKSLAGFHAGLIELELFPAKF